jgi:hypothetical protein
MKKRLLVLFMLVSFTCSAQNYLQDSVNIRRMSNYILTNAHGHEDLRYLCKQIGHRLTGSPQAAKAVAWGKKTLEEAGCDNVFLQEVMVPHWVRGEEEAYYEVGGRKYGMKITSLGNAVGTGYLGVKTSIVMVNDIEEFDRLPESAVRGKIVFFNYRFDQTNINTFHSYGPCVFYRWAAPSRAAGKGAAAVVIRSVSSAYDDEPHTGVLSYDKRYPKIPAIAVGNTTADKLEELVNNKKRPKMYIRTTCEMKRDVKSYNVVGEIYGTEIPKEIICFGGHLDSWDVGEGAHDDGAGVVQSIDAIRTFKKLGIRPKRTIRCVLWMNEENGARGARAYMQQAKEKNENHILAIESDAGGATPYGFGLTMSAAQKDKVQGWKDLFYPYNIYNFSRKGGGVDINPLHKEFDTPTMGLLPDGHRYFDMHHSDNDVFENVHRRELCMGTIAMAMMVYLVSQHGL